FAVSAHGSLAAISDGIKIVRRMATISHFHAPSSRATLMSARWLNFPSAHCVDTLGQVTFDAFGPSRFTGRPNRSLPSLATGISIHASANVGHCRVRDVG